MTDREKAIVMAYTGACMLTGDKYQKMVIQAQSICKAESKED